MRRIAVAGEVFSANLGDQAIHASLVYLLRKLAPGIETVSLDISSRSGLAPAPPRLSLRQRLALLREAPLFHPIFRHLNAAYQQVRQARRIAAWGAALRGVDALAIGGGQLLMDDDLGFPFKLSALGRAARAAGLPYHIAACGVGETWSPEASALFTPLLCGAATITLRDQLSLARLGRQLPGLAAQVTADPAIWAGAVYSSQALPRQTSLLGLGVIHRREANIHLPPGQRFSEAAWLDLWLELLEGVLRRSLRVELFTTGSPADEQFAKHLYEAALKRSLAPAGVSLAPAPVHPAELLSRLGRCAAVAGARLHASVLANAVGVVSLGLGWDAKVRAYYAESARPELCFDLAGLRPDEVAHACADLIGQPFDPAPLKERALETARLILK